VLGVLAIGVELKIGRHGDFLSVGAENDPPDFKFAKSVKRPQRGLAVSD
jgi:hypothetical protein